MTASERTRLISITNAVSRSGYHGVDRGRGNEPGRAPSPDRVDTLGDVATRAHAPDPRARFAIRGLMSTFPFVCYTLGMPTFARSALPVYLVCAVAVLSCGGKQPPPLGLSGARLPGCPSSPNCVSSDATDASHHVDAFALSAPPAQAWRALGELVRALPRTTVVTEDRSYLHAECASALFGFVDDLELHLRASENAIEVRSAARSGYSDMGVNRRRVERLRAAMRARGAVR